MSLSYLDYFFPSGRRFTRSLREIGVNVDGIIRFPKYYNQFPSLRKALESSDIARTIGESFLELSKLDYTKMNPNSSIYKVLSKNQKISNFLEKHHQVIEKVARTLASFRFLTHRVPYIVSEGVRYIGSLFGTTVKIAKPFLLLGYVFSIGIDFYRNFKRAGNFLHAGILTSIDQLEDFNFLTGMVLGAKVGGIYGMAAGAVIGFSNSIIKIVDPYFYTNLKRGVDNWWKKSHSKSANADPEYQIDLKIISERLLFYRKLVNNLYDTLMFVKKFRYDVQLYADSKSFYKLGEHRFQRLIELIQEVKRESQQLLTELERFYLDNQKLVSLEQKILGSQSEILIFHDHRLLHLINTTKKMQERYRSSKVASYQYSFDLEKSYYWLRINQLQETNYQLVSSLAHNLQQLYSQLQTIKRKGYFENVVTDFL